MSLFAISKVVGIQPDYSGLDGRKLNRLADGLLMMFENSPEATFVQFAQSVDAQRV